MPITNFDNVNHLSLADGTPIEQCRLYGAIVLRPGQHLHRQFDEQLASSANRVLPSGI